MLEKYVMLGEAFSRVGRYRQNVLLPQPICNRTTDNEMPWEELTGAWDLVLIQTQCNLRQAT